MDKIEIAFKLGKIAGTAECIDEEILRDSIYCAAHDILEEICYPREDESEDEP